MRNQPDALQIRAALERSREDREIRLADEQAVAELRRRNQVTTKQTRHGPAKRPPSVKQQAEALDAWRAEIDDAIEVAQSALARDAAIESAHQQPTPRGSNR